MMQREKDIRDVIESHGLTQSEACQVRAYLSGKQTQAEWEALSAPVMYAVKGIDNAARLRARQ